MTNINLEAPWYTYNKKIAALFKYDPEIIVGPIYECDGKDADYAFDIEVRNHDKFIALERVLPHFKEFGFVRLITYIYDEENANFKSGTEVFESLFKGNPIVKDFKNVTDVAGTVHSFVRFKPEILQFYDDDMRDFNGNWSGLAQDIAREVFNQDFTVNFCTAAIVENENGVDVNKPLGEWP